MTRIRRSRNLALHILVAFTVTAPAAPVMARQPEDAWITTKVKISLLTDDVVDGTAVNVDTLDGGVTLHGRAASEAARANSELIAGKVMGVRDVRNLIAVIPPAARAATEIEDSELKRQIETVLDRDRALAPSDIEVKSVNDGVVVPADYNGARVVDGDVSDPGFLDPRGVVVGARTAPLRRERNLALVGEQKIDQCSQRIRLALAGITHHVDQIH